MGSRWKINRIQLFMILLLEYQRCCSLNSEGSSLLKFRDRVHSDPYGLFANWNPNDADPCLWLGVYCLDSEVHTLDLSGYSLKGTLAPELGDLTHLRSLVLSNNQFSGGIPKKLGLLTMLEVLDLSDNKLSGMIPGEMGDLKSLKCLLLSNNSFEGTIPPEIGKLSFLSEFQLDENPVPGVAEDICRVNRKFGHCFWTKILKLQRAVPISTEPHVIRRLKITANSARRSLAEQSSNLAAAPVELNDYIISLPSSRSSGSFPAVPIDLPPPTSPTPPPDSSKAWPSHSEGPGNVWKYIIGISSVLVLLSLVMAMLVICKGRTAKAIGPWKTGLSGQLQRAFTIGNFVDK